MYKQYIKTLRKNMTDPEQILWHFLRNRRFFNYKFRRQVLIDYYIVDFVCYDKKIIIELDGGQHLEPQKVIYDKKRTEYLNKEGFKVIRFYNNDILNNIEAVLEQIKQELESPSSGFQPASPVEGEALGALAPCGRGCHEVTGEGEILNKPSPLAGEGALRADEGDKSSLRKWAKEVRKNLDMKAISSTLVEKLRNLEEYKQAKNVMIFYPKENEVNLLELLNDNKNFYLPKISGQDLLCCPYNKNDELCESCFKTKEPLTEKSDITPDLIIVPALAVDKNNYRLGYGGGFYDRFLDGKNATKIVCIPSQLIVETIYPEKNDIPVDKVITF